MFAVGNVVMNTQDFESEHVRIKHTARGEVIDTMPGLALVKWFVCGKTYWWPNEDLILVNEDASQYP